MQISRPTNLSRSRWVCAGILIIIAIYAVVRLQDLDAQVTTDEPFWLGRSGNFYRALATGEYRYTYQMAHPGVMTMWAGTIAYLIEFPEYAQRADGNMKVPYAIEYHLRRMDVDPLSLMVTAKVVKVAFQVVCFGIAMLMLSKLTDDLTLMLTGTLIAFSPMLSGFDSALHVDGLFTIACFAAIAAICWAGSRPEMAFA